MKKSYLALGLVAAVAMSSCSNDEPMPNNGNGNQNLAQGYEPVKLSMTNSFADVEVSGARTRGTGTVGSMDESKNLWQHEDIYVLMTSTQTREHNGEKTPTWGFTSALGNGPFLFEQFDGSFWARPTTSKSENEKNVSVLDYTIDRNEWWWGGSIDRFYPLSGASQFFAYHIDDAVDQNALADVKVMDEENNPIGRERSHQYPALTMNEDKNAYSVKFDLDGSQDLMAGYAPIPETGYAAQDKGFSARSARQGAVPQITMNHLLSRLTFEVVKGGDNFDRVTLKGIEVVSKHKGDMVVAINPNFEVNNPWENVGKITWAEGEGSTEAFALKQVADKYIVDENGKVGTYKADPTTDVYYNIYEGLYANVKNVTSEDVIIAEEEVDEAWMEDGAIEAGISILVDGKEYDVMYNNETDKFYYTKETITITKTTLTEEQVEGLTNNPAAKTSLEAGKAKLVDFAAVDLKDFALTKNDTKTVGEAMFVAPGVSEYTLTLKMAYLVRDGEAEELATLEQAVADAGADVYTMDRALKVAQAVLINKQNAQAAAKAAFDKAEADLAGYEEALDKAQKAYDAAEDAYQIAQQSGKEDLSAENKAKNDAQTALDAAKKVVDDFLAGEYKAAKDALDVANEAVAAQESKVADAEEALAAALAAEQTAKDNLAKFEPVVEEMTQDLTVKLPEGGQFTAGKSYNIRITIYGYEPAEVEVSLTPWKDGGHFDVGGDDDDPNTGDYYENGHEDDEDDVVEDGE